MPPPFLEVFPRELRDQIYAYVLASSSGLVTLSPWTTEVARSLSLLRTCKQVHRECKDLIWSHNGLSLREPTQLFEKFKVLGDRRHVRRLRQLSLGLEIMDRDELEWMADGLRGLENWCRMGRLESITLSTDWERPRGLGEFNEVLRLTKHGESLDGRLYEDSITWTKMIVKTGWPRFSHWGKQKWLKEMLLDPSGIESLLRGIHDFFGGDLYIDGILALTNGKTIRGIDLNPRIGEVRIVPRLMNYPKNENTIY